MESKHSLHGHLSLAAHTIFILKFLLANIQANLIFHLEIMIELMLDMLFFVHGFAFLKLHL